jgi:hypothetical protein
MITKQLQDLEHLAAELLEPDRKLSPGPDRQDVLKKVGSFVTQIVSVQRSPASRKIEIK